MQGPRPTLHPLRRRASRLVRAVAAATTGLLVLAAVPASAGGVVGDPQPELAPFHVAAASSNGSGAVLSNGDIVLATPSASGTTITTCLLAPGGRTCAASATLHAYSDSNGQDTFSGTVEVISTGDTVDVVAYDCCYLGAATSGVSAVIFRSTDGGRTWGPLTQAGDIASIGAATYADGIIVVGSFEQGSLQVQAFSPVPTIPEASYATPIPGCLVATPPSYCADGDTALATYHGGVLVASDDTTNTHVEFAPSGSGLNSSTSYAHVATFANELTVAASGNALLTDPGGSITGGDRLRFFNGTSFGPGYKVPDSKMGDDGYFGMQETGNAVHVFFLSRRMGYDVYEETTTNGARWSPLVQYASAIQSTSLVPVLGPSGAGLLDETAGAPEAEQPVLLPQSVHVAFAAPRVRLGHHAVLHGSAAPRLAGQLVTLQIAVGHAWDPVKSTRETLAGTFSFTVGGATATYRAVVNLKPGYYEYGYSNAATVTAIT